MMKVHFVCFYDKNINLNVVNFFSSSSNKIDYLIESISDEYEIDLYSLCNLRGNYHSQNLSSVERLSDKVRLKRFYFLKQKNKLKYITSWIKSRLDFCFDFIASLKKNDIVIVYHSSSFFWFYLFLCFFDRRKIVIEIEEFYSKVPGNGFLSKFSDYLAVNLFDNFIVPTEIQSNRLKSAGKKVVVVHGDLRVSNENYFLPTSRSNNQLLYAGSLRRDKGVIGALEILSLLPDRFSLFIAGKGSEDDVEHFEKHAVSLKLNKNERFFYVGELDQIELKSLYKKSRFGFVTQDIDSAYNSSSFPSKLISYLANDLIVVAPAIDSIISSPFGDATLIYKDYQEAAKLILNVDFDNVKKGSSKVKEVAVSVKRDLIELFKSMSQ